MAKETDKMRDELKKIEEQKKKLEECIKNEDASVNLDNEIKEKLEQLKTLNGEEYEKMLELINGLLDIRERMDKQEKKKSIFDRIKIKMKKDKQEN